ncbi:MAG: C_GCAxxG_C_C family protein [Firmicutes bacterium]|nr:C_GCAxxG_C_C family protein [Bacillota bacterium]
MSKYLEKAEELRAIEVPHHNCAQSVLMSFGSLLDMDADTLYKVAVNFGGGMKCGSTCGVITGGLMALGLLGADDAETAECFFRTIAENHSGCSDCRDLLRMNEEAGNPKKQHCDGLVYESVALVEKILKDKGIIE